MEKITASVFYGPESELNKYHFGGYPEGTLEIFGDHIDVYVKSKALTLGFGLMGALMAGKGKATASIPRTAILSYANPKPRNYTLYLSDGNILFINLLGLSPKKNIGILQDFLQGRPIG